MTNGEKYNTAQERAEAYKDWWQSEGVFHALLADCIKEAFAWLDLEAEEEKPLPCPFCGGECKTLELFLEKDHFVVCDKCRYTSAKAATEAEAIAAHNRVAKAAKESEAK